MITVNKDKLLKNAKEKKYTSIKKECSDIIYEQYDIQKQMNIQLLLLGYTEADRQKMNDFITYVVEEYRELKVLIGKKRTKTTIDAVKFKKR